MAKPTSHLASLGARQILDGMSLPIMILDRDLCLVYANQSYLSATESDWDDIEGQYIFDAFPDSEERIAPVRSQFEKVFTGVKTHLDRVPYKLKHADGTISERFWKVSQEPITGADGQTEYMLQFAEDITSQTQLAEEKQVLLEELNHRVKNLLNMVMSIARISGRRASSTAQYVTDFSQRISAMAKSHDRLFQNKWVGTSVKDIFEDVLTIVEKDYAHRITLAGPSITLSANHSRDLSLFVHELTTNAVKYGCFAGETGNLSVSWERTTDGVQILWKESGLSGVTEPKELGFGSQLMKLISSVKVDRAFEEDGLRVSMALTTRPINNLT